MPGRVSIDAFRLPGYETPDALPPASDVQTQQTAKPYNIPPVIWMVLFLVIGYVGVRFLLED